MRTRTSHLTTHELSFDRTDAGAVASCACGWTAVSRLDENDSHYDGALHLAAESRVAEERAAAAAVAEELARQLEQRVATHDYCPGCRCGVGNDEHWCVHDCVKAGR